jgi:hypothetical protein
MRRGLAELQRAEIGRAPGKAVGDVGQDDATINSR